MDWGAIIQIVLAIVGAGAIVGGIVAYRRSKRTGVRAFGASASAAGAVMWVIVLLTVPLSTSGEQPAPDVQPVPEVNMVMASDHITLGAFSGLLTNDDIRALLETDPSLKDRRRMYDYKAMAEKTDPALVAEMDSFYGISFETTSGLGLTLSTIDFDTASWASSHFQRILSEDASLAAMDLRIGDLSARSEVNMSGVGSMVLFLNGDKVVSLHTTMGLDDQPLIPLEGLESLARLVEQRL